MLWFQRFFPALMVLFPLAFTLITARHPERAHDDVPQHTRRWWFTWFPYWSGRDSPRWSHHC